MADNKTKPTRVSVEAFLESLADASKRADTLVPIELMQGATGEKPAMRGPSTIGFGSYHYESGREGDSPVVGFPTGMICRRDGGDRGLDARPRGSLLGLYIRAQRRPYRSDAIRRHNDSREVPREVG